MSDPVLALLDEYRVALSEAAREEAGYERLEHLRKVVIAEEMDTSLPEWKADAGARSTRRYAGHLEELAKAKLSAGEARAKAIYLAERLGIWRTREASRRAQSKGER